MMVEQKPRPWWQRIKPWTYPQLPIFLALAVIVGGSWGFVELASEVIEGDTKAFDEWALQAMRNPDNPADPLGPRWLEEAGRDITALGGVAVLSIVILAVCGYLLLSGTYRTMIFVALATTTGMSVSMLMKRVFARPRPEVVEHLSYVMSSSFPSGHTMMSAIVYLTLGGLLASIVESRWLKAYLISTALLLTALVGLSRIYVGVHYPTDVMAGWTAGLVWASACLLLFRFLQSTGEVEQRLEEAGHKAEADAS